VFVDILFTASGTGMSALRQSLFKRNFMNTGAHGWTVGSAVISSSGFGVVHYRTVWIRMAGFAGTEFSAVFCVCTVDSSGAAA